jgi:hypothetical protein
MDRNDNPHRILMTLAALAVAAGAAWLGNAAVVDVIHPIAGLTGH